MVYCIGIGGIGMSALARFFKAQGLQVAGYDKVSTALTSELVKEGIEIHFEDNLKLIPESFRKLAKNEKEKNTAMIIYTPAIPPDHQELQFFQQNGFMVRKRAQVLGYITKCLFTIAVGGTHGKTSTSSMIAHILKQSGHDCTAFLGGITVNYNTNYLESKQVFLSQDNYDNSNKPLCVVEADEYDRSFLELYPDIAVITSMDADHLDIYHTKQELNSSYQQFAGQVKKDGLLVVKNGIPIKVDKSKCKVLTYSIKDKSDYNVCNIRVHSSPHTQQRDSGKIKMGYLFDITGPNGVIKNLKLELSSSYNIENATAAVAVAQNMGIENGKIQSAINSYSGVKRRFEFIYRNNLLTYIDDYAHHPNEISACLKSVRELYPDKKITLVFQPHLFTRTRDFMDDFAESISETDELVLLPVYPAREMPIPGISSEVLLSKVKLKNKILCTKENLLNHLKSLELEVLLTLGAGDIDAFVKPLKKLCREKASQKIYAGLKHFFDGEVLLNEAMSNHTTLKIGGPADVFLKPVSKEGIIKAVAYLENNSISFIALGRGSNMLVGDEGIPGVVIAMNYGLDYMEFRNDVVIAGAAYNWPKLVLETIKNNYEGLEGTAGIPASVGGVTSMNAGAYGTEVFDYITEVHVLRKGQFKILKANEIEFGYRHTNLKEDIILETTFKLKKAANTELVMNKRKELLEKRNLTQPLNKPNVGSLFKNPQGDFAARLIEESGLKGFKHGNVQVSEKHANFLINNGGGTAKQMMELIDIVRKKVHEKFNIWLEMEVLKIGEGF